MSKKGQLPPEDYAEPRCLLCEEAFGVTAPVKAVPQQRIIEKMNEYMSHRDYDGAERHLKYWLEEAVLGADKGGELMLCNELVGHYRKTGNRDGAFETAARALTLIKELDFENNVSAGTTYINIATAFNAFGENEKAIELFQKAKAIYEANENTDPSLLGGLYNNMALTFVALCDFENAFELYEKALAVMETVDGGCLEQAITYLNMADALEARDGAEQSEAQMSAWLDKAYTLLTEGEAPHDGYYAFVCEKCAPSFSYYGYFLAANELNQRAEAIYAGT